MRYRQLGRSGVRVSPLAVGTANFGWVTDESDAHHILDVAYARGVNLIDTASNYNAGESEEIVGRWLNKGSDRRDQVVIASKVYYPPNKYASKDPAERSGANAGPNAYGLSARHIKLECEASLRRLGVEYIDLYQLHHVDRLTPMEEVWQAVETLIGQGKVIYVGTSNFAGWHLARACETARARDLLGPVSEQSLYNLLQRTVELEVLPACEAYGVGFLPFSPLAGGLLGVSDQPGRRSAAARKQLPPRRREQLERFAGLCYRLGHPPSAVATAWLLGRPGVASVVVGPRTIDHLDAPLRALDLTLDDATMTALDDLFPGPGGPAPEAYAW